MKNLFRKGLSLILAATLMLCVFPAAGAEETETTSSPTYEYVFTKDKLSPATPESLYKMADAVNAEFVDREKGHSWKPLGNGKAMQSSAFYAGGYNYSVGTGSKIGENGTLFRITVAEDGIYVPAVNYFMYKWGSEVKVYLSSTERTDGETSGDYVKTTVNGTDKEVLFTGEFKTYQTGIGTQYSVPGNKDFENARIALEKDKNYYLVFSIDGENTSNDSDTRLNYYQLYSFTLTKVGDLEEEAGTVSGNVSFGAYSDVTDSITVTIDGEASENAVESVAVGKTVKAVADTTNPDYKFLGWKRGSKDNGVWLTDDATVQFPIMTNTFLTAVYEPVADEATVNVEFYNYNGQYLDTAEDVGNKAFSEIAKPAATLTGYSNPFWTLDGETEIANNTTFQKLTRIVAMYAYKDKHPVTIGEGISGAEENDTYAYDTVLNLSAGANGIWYVNKKPVAYGASYKHIVWDVAEITFEEAAEITAPIISIDDTTKLNGARMISYDANGAEIVEVGILFGDNADIGSFSGGKATSKENGDKCGQFTAKPYNGDGTIARGYMIYKEGNSYKVIYSE